MDKNSTTQTRTHKIDVRTLTMLRLLSALTEESMKKILTRLITTELERVQNETDFTKGRFAV